MILEKNTTILGKNSAIFSKIGKVYLLIFFFFFFLLIHLNWECSRLIGNIFCQLRKNLVPETGPSFV